LEVAELDIGDREEVDVSEDAAEAEHVLVFQIASIAPAVDLDGEEVFAGLEVLGEIEFGGTLGVFAIAHIFAV